MRRQANISQPGQNRPAATPKSGASRGTGALDIHRGRRIVRFELAKVEPPTTLTVPGCVGSGWPAGANIHSAAIPQAQPQPVAATAVER